VAGDLSTLFTAGVPLAGVRAAGVLERVGKVAGTVERAGAAGGKMVGEVRPAIDAVANLSRRAEAIRARLAGRLGDRGFVKDFYIDGATENHFPSYHSEGEARALARQKLGSDPVEVEPNKWRSRDGKWQYRANKDDVEDNHVHLEELNPDTGEVLRNWHLSWPEGTER
jgi:hypothetical protein